jgi:hypothetical protein
MDWFQAACLGAAGGGLVQLVAFYVSVGSWQDARRQRPPGDDSPPPPLSWFIDLPADSAVTLTRLALGASAGLLFHAQIVGVAAAVAVGASAPALLQQLGNIRTVREAVQYADSLSPIEDANATS